MKLTVAIIERDALLREVLRKKVEAYASECDVEICISTFENPCEFEGVELAFHLLITDTEFDGPITDGIAWIKEQKDERRYLHVIYVSALEERVFDSIQTNPIAFVRKKNLEDDLKNAWDVCMNRKEKEPSFVIIPEGRKRHIYTLENIVILNSNGHYIDVLLHNEEKRVLRGKLSEMEEILKDYGFLRIHTSHLVNIKYIESVDRKKICLLDKTTYNMSSKYIKDVYKRLSIYMYE